MTVTVTCQYTGIEFEAASKRSKNHPLVSDLLNEAANSKERSAYRTTQDALAEAKQAGMTDIDEIVEFVRDAVANGAEQARQRRQAKAQQERERQEATRRAKEQRDAQNAHLRSHGYKWHKNYAYDFDHYEEPDGTYEWDLHAPDGRIVSVEQALDEIERGADVVLAEIAEQEAIEAEAERQAEAEAQAFDDQWQAAQSHTEVKSFDYKDAEIVAEREWYAGKVNRILRMTINGVTCYVTERDSFDMPITRFFCKDVDAAGLTPVERDELSQTLTDFFG